MNKPLCQTCVYWYCPDWPEYRLECMLPERSEHEGKCRRYPPTLVSISRPEVRNIGSPLFTEEPTVLACDWCGEHPDFPAYIASLKAPVSINPDDMSVRARNAIRRLGDDIRKITYQQLVDAKDCGQSTRNEILNFAKANGIIIPGLPSVTPSVPIE